MTRDSKMRILAVDDDAVFLRILRETLEQMGFSDAVYCESAAQVLNVLEVDRRGFDCLLVDIKMPGMDGIELTKRVRQIPALANTPVLMLTAMAEHRYIDEAFLAGASDYITKPLNKAELSARLRAAEALRHEQTRLMAPTGSQSPNALSFRFSDPVQLHDLKGMLQLVALRNYALTLGNLRMLSWKAVGISVVGAAEFYGACGPQQYLEMMQDVGSVLFDTLKRGRLMMAHAGGGSFVAFVTRQDWPDTTDIESQANAFLDPFNDFFTEISPIAIQVAVGEPQYNGLLSLKAADAPIDRALTSAAQRAAALSGAQRVF